MFKKVCLLAALTLASSAFAQDASCVATAAEKKLAGAAKNAYLKKCEKDAAAKCEIASKEKKLAGANKPVIATDSKPGRPAAATVGRCGTSADGAMLVTANARSRPVRTYGVAAWPGRCR